MHDDLKHKTVSVESLLRLKRCEQPDEAFWDSFEQNFHRRRLNSLVEQSDASGIFSSPLLRIISLAVPALGLLALGVLGWRTQESSAPLLPEVSGEAVAHHEAKALERYSSVAAGQFSGIAPGADHVTSQFVLDAIEERSSASHAFRKVLYSPALQAVSPVGASYVRDSLSTRSYKVTTADVKLGRNF